LVELPICEGEGEIMPRQARIALAGVPVHIIQRGHNRSVCFFSDQDFVRYLDELAELSVRSGCAVHAYCLMTNHVHLLLTPQEADGCARLMKHLGQRYVQHVNRTYRRSGTLWEGRFRSCLVETERYLFVCGRYIELNPVRAAMVSHPREYRWSSYRANAEGARSDLIKPHDLYRTLGGGDQARRDAYRGLFQDQDMAAIKEIRLATNGGFVLGGERFRSEVARMAGRRVVPGKAGRPAREIPRVRP
jgi:putative transposase